MQVLPDRQQPGDILGRIFALGVGQRALQPVGTGLALGQVHVADQLDQGAVAQPKPHIQQRRRPLGIEQRLGQHAQPALEHFQVLTGGVQHLGDRGVDQQVRQRRRIGNGQRIDQQGLITEAQLHQRDLGKKRIAAHELGIHRHCGATRHCLQGAAQGGIGLYQMPLHRVYLVIGRPACGRRGRAPGWSRPRTPVRRPGVPRGRYG